MAPRPSVVSAMQSLAAIPLSQWQDIRTELLLVRRSAATLAHARTNCKLWHATSAVQHIFPCSNSVPIPAATVMYVGWETMTSYSEL